MINVIVTLVALAPSSAMVTQCMHAAMALAMYCYAVIMHVYITD